MAEGNDGFQLTYEHPVADPAPGPARPVISVGIRLIWPDGATADEVGTALTAATAHALTQHNKRTEN